MEAETDLIFLGSKITWTVAAAMKLKDAPWKESYDKPRQHIEKQRHHFANKSPYSQSYSHATYFLDSVLKSRDIALPTRSI